MNLIRICIISTKNAPSSCLFRKRSGRRTKFNKCYIFQIYQQTKTISGGIKFTMFLKEVICSNTNLFRRIQVMNFSEAESSNHVSLCYPMFLFWSCKWFMVTLCFGRNNVIYNAPNIRQRIHGIFYTKQDLHFCRVLE